MSDEFDEWFELDDDGEDNEDDNAADEDEDHDESDDDLNFDEDGDLLNHDLAMFGNILMPDVIERVGNNVHPNSDNESTEENEPDDNNDEYINLVSYDIGLPLQHSYLGGLENQIQSGRIIFSDGTKLRLPLIYLTGIILVPGQEIPFTFRHPVLVAFFRRIINNDSRTFGIGYDQSYGTTAEIRDYSYDDDGGEISFKAEGRQRFEIVNKQLEQFEIYNANVIILPDIDIKDFQLSLRRIDWKYSRHNLLQLTGLPPLVYRQFDDKILIEKLTNILSNIIQSTAKTADFQYPKDAGPFSYFVLSSIPFSDSLKAKLLRIDCCIQRLRIEHELLSVPFEFKCSNCSAKLCNRQDFLVMSKRGTGGTFVNQAGIVHELYTFSKVQNVQSMSDLNFEYSWFPNYGWIIIRCQQCMIHLGWRFKTNQPNIKPKSFYAITRTAMHISFSEIEQDSFVYSFVNGTHPAPLQ